MAGDVADYTQAVNITGGSVSISGTASVSIVGTPTVLISGTPTVNIGNTPSVSITSGSVTATISGTPNINIQSQAVTLNVNQPQSALADLVFPNGTSTQTTAAVPAGTHALQLTFTGAFTSFAVKGHQTLIQYAPQDAGSLGANAFPPNVMVWVIPVNSIQDTTYDCVATQATGGNVTVKVSAILDSQAVWVQSTKVNPVWVAQVGSVSATGAFVARAAVIQEYDATGTSSPASGSQATVTLAASSGKRYIAHLFIASCYQTAAQAIEIDVQILDGATIIYAESVGNLATIGDSAKGGFPAGAVPCTAGNSVTAKFQAAGASIKESVNIGAYLRA